MNQQAATAVATRLSALVTADPTRLLAFPATTCWELFQCLRGLGDLQGAAALLEAIAADSKPLAKIYDAQAQLWPLLGRDDDAVAAAEARAEQFPSRSGTLALARTYLATERLEEATALASQLLTQNPHDPQALLLQAHIALEQGDGEGAIAWYEMLRADDETAGEGELLPARAHAAMGDEAAAEHALRDYVGRLSTETPPGSLTAWAALADDLGDEVTARDLRQRAYLHWATRAELVLSDLAALEEASDAVEPVIEPPLAHEPEAEPTPAVLATLHESFGYRQLRPGQWRVIDQVLRGEDTLATMPTGAGKSLCYQLPALLLSGVTLVISPLIALMQDQLSALHPSVAARTTLINSAVGAAENRRRQADIARGRYQIVYAAPERLRQAPFLRALMTAGVARLVIDEAHCISLWGHDFRPDYLVIPHVLPALGNPPVLALTATATPEIAAEIGQRLGRELTQVQASPFRPNLFYQVERLANREEKLREIVKYCRDLDGSGIVYVSSRKGCEEVAQLLNRELKNWRGDPDVALAYHAGFGPADRAERQERFMRGEVRIIVATVAFGMGVDKRDVRFIIHLSPPESLEAYIQESGRAGRDGAPARCILLYAPADKSTLSRRARGDAIEIELLRRVYAQLRRLLGRDWGILTFDAILPESGADDDLDLRVVLGLLERAGLVERHPDAPRTIEVVLRRQGEPPASAQWQEFLDATGLAPGEAGTIDAVATAAYLGISPAELEGLLLGWAEETTALDVVPGPRDLCLHLVLPAPPDVATTLPRLLADLRRGGEARLARMLAYVNQTGCRHVALAAHLGARLSPCRTACDNCTRVESDRTPKTGAAHRARQQPATPATAAAPVTDTEAAKIILECLQIMPFPVGKSGLIKVLTGSITAAIREDRMPLFGALAAWNRSRLDTLLDRLIADGLIERGDDEYRRLTLTRRGAEATAADLAIYARPASPPRPTTQARLTTGTARPAEVDMDDSGELDAEQQVIFERLRAWRAEQARERSVPAYIIAHDSQLREVAARRPTSLGELGVIKGFGPAKLDTYGEAILTLLDG